MEKSVDYYMNLRYTVELKPIGRGYRASIKELPECLATVHESDSVEKLWQLLEQNQRAWIERELEMGREVPEPPGATKDPFWKDYEEAYPNFDEEYVRSDLYEYGATSFPLRILEGLWLEELERVRLGEVRPSSGIPPKAEINHHDQRTPWLKGDVRPVRVGKAGKGAWIRLDGPRTKYGYRNIELFDKPLRTEAAIVAALTTLEASKIEDDDYKRLREELLRYVEAHPDLRSKGLQDVLNELPRSWFLEREVELDEKLKRIDALLRPGKGHFVKNSLTEDEQRIYKDLQNRLPKPWGKWERSYRLWERSVRYIVALLRYRRPDFDDYALEDQLKLVDEHRKRINEFLKEQREYMAFLEYGTLEGTRNAPKRARHQVRAAILRDVEKRSHRYIAEKLAITFDEERYEGDMKIPEVAALVREGRRILDDALAGEGGWQRRAQEMKAEAERYNSLDEESKLVERMADNTGQTAEDIRSFLSRNGMKPSEFMATDFLDPRPRP